MSPTTCIVSLTKTLVDRVVSFFSCCRSEEKGGVDSCAFVKRGSVSDGVIRRVQLKCLI